MSRNLKIIGIGALAALGLASAAVAQQGEAGKPAMSAEQHRQMMAGGNMAGRGEMMGGGQMMGMMIMNDPKMREQMAGMMSGCGEMMKQMGDMSHTNNKPKG